MNNRPLTLIDPDGQAAVLALVPPLLLSPDPFTKVVAAGIIAGVAVGALAVAVDRNFFDDSAGDIDVGIPPSLPAPRVEPLPPTTSTPPTTTTSPPSSTTTTSPPPLPGTPATPLPPPLPIQNRREQKQISAAAKGAGLTGASAREFRDAIEGLKKARDLRPSDTLPFA